MMIRRDIADYLHARRIAATLPGTVVAREDGQFLVHLIATAALGDAIYGAQFRRSAGLAEGAETDRRSRAWLSALIRPRGTPFEPNLSSVGALAGSGFAIAAAPPNSGESLPIAAEVLKEEDSKNR
jgi:hypothetical protein